MLFSWHITRHNGARLKATEVSIFLFSNDYNAKSLLNVTSYVTFHMLLQYHYPFT